MAGYAYRRRRGFPKIHQTTKQPKGRAGSSRPVQTRRMGQETTQRIEALSITRLPGREAVLDHMRGNLRHAGGHMARFSGGWIKLYRSAVESDIGNNPNCLALFIILLTWANREESTIRWNGQPRKLPRGSLVTGLRELADRLGVSKDTVQRHLKYLHQRDTIRTEVATAGTLITVVNYSDYQDTEEKPRHELRQEPDKNETPPGREQGHDPTLNGEVKKERNIYTREETSECVQEWAKTLDRFGIKKDPWGDQVVIFRLMQAHGKEKTKLALFGAGFETKSDKYNPALHCRITRLQKPDIFDLFVNLGAQNQPTVREYHEEGVAC